MENTERWEDLSKVYEAALRLGISPGKRFDLIAQRTAPGMASSAFHGISSTNEDIVKVHENQRATEDYDVSRPQ